MNYYSKIYLLFLFFLEACSLVNNTNYQKLNEYDREKFLKFQVNQCSKVNYKDSFHVYEINYQDILNLSESTHKKIWIHFFAPWCNTVSAKNLEHLQSIQEHFNDSLILLLVSTSYDYSYLADLLISLKLTTPIFVLDGKEYGNSITRSQERFYKELSKTSKSLHYDDYVVYNKELVYSHPWKLPVDSLEMKLKDIIQ